MAGRMRAEPDPMAEHVRREVLDVLGVHLGAASNEQRPHLGEAAPADDRPRRGAQIDAALDERIDYVEIKVEEVARKRAREELGIELARGAAEGLVVRDHHPARRGDRRPGRIPHRVRRNRGEGDR